jgi:hypothetical protein
MDRARSVGSQALADVVFASVRARAELYRGVSVLRALGTSACARMSMRPKQVDGDRVHTRVVAENENIRHFRSQTSTRPFGLSTNPEQSG